MSKQLEDIRDSKGMLPAYAWPGGYPILYVAVDGGVFCPDCANGKNDSDATTKASDYPDDQQWLLVAHMVNWEGDPLDCDHCGEPQESAYGPVDDDR